MSEKKYWKSFGELNLTESLSKDQENEFREDLPGAIRRWEGYDGFKTSAP